MDFALDARTQELQEQLLDFMAAREARPELPLPVSTGYPGGEERFLVHMRSAREVHAAHFGKPPQGFWPAEGGVSAPVLQLFSAEGVRWAASGEHVLITGESGTGKELIARAVHDASTRVDKSFVTVNCGRLDAHTAESELFGHMQGAFTSAVKARAGLFELADNGTLFMDEISEMPLDVQVKLLRVLETGTFRRLGGSRDIKVDVRFVFASNKNLTDCVERGSFREDLYHRINLLPIGLPPLRDRKEDIYPLALHFLKDFAGRWESEWEITDEALAGLCSYHWPGNIRELKNTIRRACILATEPVISADLLPFATPKAPLAVRESGEELVPEPLWVVEREHIGKVLAQVDGNKSKAARILEIDRKTLYTKLERYDLAG